MQIFNEQWLVEKYQLFKRNMPRASSRFDFETFSDLVYEIVFVSSKSAEHNFFLSDKTIKKIKDLIQEQ